MTSMALGDWLRGFLGSARPNDSARRPKGKSKRTGFLVAEQRDLAEYADRVWGGLKDRLNNLSESVGQNASDSRSMERIKTKQRETRIALMRLETGLRREQDLRRELEEWRCRRGEGQTPDFNHPAIRTAIAQSELSVRGMLDGSIALPLGKEEAVQAKSNEKSIAYAKNTSEASVETLERQPSVRLVHVHKGRGLIDGEDAEGLVKTIRSTSRDVARQWKSEDAQEKSSLLAHIRDLHAHLRRLDRAKGVRRDRLAITDGLKRVFQQD